MVSNIYSPLVCIGQDNCILNFTQQPVTQVECNVYEQPVIVLTCSVESLSHEAFPDTSVIEIRWYFNNGTEHELTTGVDHRRMGGTWDPVQVTSTLNISGTFNQRFSSLGEGFYYCQVDITDMAVVSNFSQRFQVLSRNEHLQISSRCNGEPFIANIESCAAYQVTTDVLATTEIAQTTTQASDNQNENTDSSTHSEVTWQPTTSDENQKSEGITNVWVYVLIGVVAILLIIIVTLIVFGITLCQRLSRPSIAQGKISSTV